ncbi:MAG: hypothetical protein HZA46_23810 [Planctomycetales bacterium]|nr:hypothetical protein [Planctomycetales bacterium]
MAILASLHFDNVAHAWVWLLLALGGAVLLYRTYTKIFARSEQRLTWLLMGLRGFGLVALLLALAKPTWTRDLTDVAPGRVAVVIDNSVSMQLAAGGGSSRYDAAKQAVRSLEQSLNDANSGPHVTVDLFDVQGQRLADSPPAEPRVRSTDLVRAVSQAVTQLRSKLLLGVIVISDGAANVGSKDARGLSELRVPVHTVGFPADPQAGALDVALRVVKSDKSVIVHNATKVDVQVTKSAGPATTATVTIQRGREAVATQQVNLPAGQTETVVSVQFTPAETGNFVYTVAVAAESGERQLANNREHFPLQVNADPIRVFYIDGFLRYEYRFLVAALKDDPDVSLVSVVRRLNPERTDTAGNDPLLTAERLKSFDVVLLGDMEGSMLSASEYQALVDWVQAGHSLLVLGGYRSFGPDGFCATPLADALPIVFVADGMTQTEEPFVLNITEEGWRRYPMFKLSGDRVKDSSLWSAAPPLAGAGLVQRLKPGADALAVNPQIQIDGQPAVVMAAQRYGQGHTVVLTADTTWRWSRLTRVVAQADTLYTRFWSQTIRWLAGREQETKRTPLVVSTDRPDYDVGKTVGIRVVGRSDFQSDQTDGLKIHPTDAGLPTDEVTVSAEVVDETGKSLNVPLRANSAEPHVFLGNYTPSLGGRYELHATLKTTAGAQQANQTTEFLVHGEDLELADAGTDSKHLQAIAAATGGTYHNIDAAKDVADQIERRERRLTRTETTELWDSPALFLFFLAAVTVEWLLRRKWQLV